MFAAERRVVLLCDIDDVVTALPTRDEALGVGQKDGLEGRDEKGGDDFGDDAVDGVGDGDGSGVLRKDRGALEEVVEDAVVEARGRVTAGGHVEDDIPDDRSKEVGEGAEEGEGDADAGDQGRGDQHADAARFFGRR